jgi:ribonucleoside-diphosphate reductase alpha chain
MAVLSVYHKDILEFISAKSKESQHLLLMPKDYVEQMVARGVLTEEEGQDHIEYCRKAGLFQLFNLSVAVDRNFMDNVRVYMKDGNEKRCHEMLPCGKSIAEVWDAIVDQAWNSGDPGILFMDRAREWGKLQSPLAINGTNPCGEQFLPSHGSCNLGSVNLAAMVHTPIFEHRNFGWAERIDWDQFKDTIGSAVRFLDNVVLINKHAISDIAEVNEQERRIGLGIMGWADLLLMCGVPYDSNQAVEVADSISARFRHYAHRASCQLAEERGIFPLWDELQDLKLDDNLAPGWSDYFPQEPRRNAAVTTIAPTGTISVVAGCSSGVEPHFLMAFEHEGLREHGGLGLMWASETLREVCQHEFPHLADEDKDYLGAVEEVLRSKYNWKPANEIDIKWHIRHQAAWQKNIDNSISKTLNLPNSATRDDVARAYLMAYETGCKGSTIYRDRCKPSQVLNAPKPRRELSEAPQPSLIAEPGHIELGNSHFPTTERPGFVGETCTICGAQHSEASGECKKCKAKGAVHIGSGEGSIPESEAQVATKVAAPWAPRPEVVPGYTRFTMTAEGKLYVTVNYDERGMPYEMFVELGKAGSSTNASCDAIARLVSTMLRSGIHPYRIVKQLRGLKSNPYGIGPQKVLSVPDAIAQSLEKYMVTEFGHDWAVDFGWGNGNGGKQQTLEFEKQEVHEYECCPDCGTQLALQENCKTCIACGYSQCT